jgi:glutamate racemase
LVNPAEEMAIEVKKELNSSGLLKKNLKNLQSLKGKHEFIVSDKNRISRSFLEHGRRFLKLENLDFKEDNIFNTVKK